MAFYPKMRAAAAASIERMDLLRWLSMMAMSCVFVVLLAQSALAQNFRFNSVDIQGNRRIEDATIQNYIGVTQGSAISAEQLNRGYQALVQTGLFETVDLIPSGGKLIVKVKEFPTISRVVFEGNRKIKDEALAVLVRSQPRFVYNPIIVEEDRAAIIEAYANAGRLAAKVTPKIIRQSDNRVDVIYEVFEGGQVEVERIGVVGNRAFSDRRLRRVLNTKQTGLLRALVRRDVFIEDQVEFDKQVLSDFYQSRGYVDFRVNNVSAEFAEERDGYFMTFNVREGQQFRFGAISASTDLTGVDIAAFQKAIKSKPGRVYSPFAVETDIARLERLAVKRGYDFIRINPVVSRNNESLTLDVDYVVERGPRIFVERIDIEGNTATLDQVIRRQFRTVEGDPFNPRDIRQTAERIRALGFFSNADVNAREGTREDQVIIDVNVAEQPTGSMSFGASYSTNDGLGGIIEYNERNFLGRGQQLNLSLKGGADNQTYSLKFTEPAFLHNDLKFSLNASYRETNNQNAAYDTTIAKLEPSLTFPISDDTYLSLRATTQFNDITGVQTQGAIIGNEATAGKVVSNGLGYTLSYDNRRTGLDPNSGVLLQFGQDFSGLGGDTRGIKTLATAVGQKRVWNEEVTLRATIEGGMLNYTKGESRVVDRFVLGSDVIRGFEPGGLGPREVSSTANDALGGEMFAAVRLEAEFPLGIPEEYGLSGGVYYDMANLWSLPQVNGDVLYEDGSWRHVVGASLFWQTPIGPLRFNFSKALKKETQDIDRFFELTISTSF